MSRGLWSARIEMDVTMRVGGYCVAGLSPARPEAVVPRGPVMPEAVVLESVKSYSRGACCWYAVVWLILLTSKLGGDGSSLVLFLWSDRAKSDIAVVRLGGSMPIGGGCPT